MCIQNIHEGRLADPAKMTVCSCSFCVPRGQLLLHTRRYFRHRGPYFPKNGTGSSESRMSSTMSGWLPCASDYLHSSRPSRYRKSISYDPSIPISQSIIPRYALLLGAPEYSKYRLGELDRTADEGLLWYAASRSLNTKMIRP